MKFTIKNRYSGSVQCDAEIECDATARAAVKIGLAAKWACKTGAVLRDADLRDADLTGALLHGADLRDALLHGALLHGVLLRGVPKIENIDARILAAIEVGGQLKMDKWHACETAHCRAGWAITLAGAAGAALEFALGSATAGALIYAQSRPDKPIPNFYDDDETALADIRQCAAERTINQTWS